MYASGVEELRGSSGCPAEANMSAATVRENIAYARPDAAEAEIVAAAHAAHAMEFIDRLPHGFDTRVGERGVKLPPGVSASASRSLGCSSRTPPIVILD